ncbi:hypothetical protein [Capsulimonas corticalis]|nr:hypothetical protein [Capsulimonas corticalis]
MTTIRNLTALAFFIVMMSSYPAHACLNDRDTLALEARRKPEALAAITGRFERNPPLYYQMRIARVQQDLQTHPDSLDEYDDIAVACDRLGRDDEAIGWMERKRAHLTPLATADAAMKEQWYKYNANIGTARIHRWLRGGGDQAKIAEVQKADDEIARAIAIKPDAHFGREKYQLRIIEWILKSENQLRSHLATAPLSVIDRDKNGNEDGEAAATGLAGLVTLGNAWESVDVFGALGESLRHIEWGSEADANHLAGMAAARVAELRQDGKKSLFPEANTVVASKPNPASAEDEAEFVKLRTEADQWQRARTDYMMARLTAGRHPDTDPTFWADYHEAAPPVIPDPDAEKKKQREMLKERVNAAIALVLTAIIVFPIVIVWRVVREKYALQR